jgi:hypothetical protein
VAERGARGDAQAVDARIERDRECLRVSARESKGREAVTGADVDDDAARGGDQPVGLTDVHVHEAFADEGAHVRIVRAPIAIFVALVIACGGAVPSGGASNAPSGTAPSARAGAFLVYAPPLNAVLLFGGDQADETGKVAKLHAWDGARWRIVDPGRPIALSLASVAYDTDRSTLVIYGGTTGVGRDPKDTWEWTNGVWTQRATTGPTATSHMATVYEASRKRVLMFGGNDDRPVIFGETWTWNGTAWTKIDVAGPGALAHHTMAYDPVRDRVVLFGGIGGTGTWEWDGTKWERISASGPDGRTGARLAYDAERKVMVLYGGDDKSDTWTWDGRQWRQITGTGPGVRSHHAMAYDPVRKVTVLFGGDDGRRGFNDTWEFDGASWRQVDRGS